MASKTYVEERVKAPTLNIKWPPELAAIKPVMVVEVSSTRSAEVYLIDREGKTPVHRVRCIITKTGLAPVDAQNDHWLFRGRDYEDLVEVKHHIEELARLLTKRTATRKVRTEIVDDE